MSFNQCLVVFNSFVHVHLKDDDYLTFQLKGKNKTKSQINKNVTGLLSKFKLQEKKDSLPNQLSGGQKRRVCLGMSLVGDSSVSTIITVRKLSQHTFSSEGINV